jgi:hypothetical protein
MAHISSYALRADLDYGQSPSQTPGGGANASEPWPIGGNGDQAQSTGRAMGFPASEVRRTWPHFAGFGAMTAADKTLYVKSAAIAGAVYFASRKKTKYAPLLALAAGAAAYFYFSPKLGAGGVPLVDGSTSAEGGY